MAGRSRDPKGVRITVRISEADRTRLMNEAKRAASGISAVIRDLIRERLGSGRKD
jgi:hypothetical protein